MFALHKRLNRPHCVPSLSGCFTGAGRNILAVLYCCAASHYGKWSTSQLFGGVAQKKLCWNATPGHPSAAQNREIPLPAAGESHLKKPKAQILELLRFGNFCKH